MTYFFNKIIQKRDHNFLFESQHLTYRILPTFFWQVKHHSLHLLFEANEYFSLPAGPKTSFGFNKRTKWLFSSRVSILFLYFALFETPRKVSILIKLVNRELNSGIVEYWAVHLAYIFVLSLALNCAIQLFIALHNGFGIIYRIEYYGKLKSNRYAITNKWTSHQSVQLNFTATWLPWQAR